MKRFLKITICLMLIISICLLSVGCTVFVDQFETGNEWAKDFDLLGRVYSYVNANYIGDVDVDKLDYIAAYALVTALDDFSYLSDNSMSLANDASLGISLKITKYNEYIITNVYDGYPAADVQGDGFVLQRGDFIYAVNGERVEGASRNLFNLLSEGEAGTELALTIKRDGNIVGTYTYTKVSGAVPKAYYVGDISAQNPQIGYIKLSEFSDSRLSDGSIVSATHDFDNCIEQFKKDGKQSLILDLRGNPGGSANILAHIASYFVPLSTNENGEQVNTDFLSLTYERSKEEVIVSVSEDNFIDMPLVILVDSSTASAAEALSGACRAHNSKNTTIIGETTFGKGVFQARSEKIYDKTASSFAFDDTYYITLVSGYYYILDPSYPDGRYCIHQNGIVPNEFISTEVIGALSNDAEVVRAIEILK